MPYTFITHWTIRNDKCRSELQKLHIKKMELPYDESEETASGSYPTVREVPWNDLKILVSKTFLLRYWSYWLRFGKVAVKRFKVIPSEQRTMKVRAVFPRQLLDFIHSYIRGSCVKHRLRPNCGTKMFSPSSGIQTFLPNPMRLAIRTLASSLMRLCILCIEKVVCKIIWWHPTWRKRAN